MNIRLSPFVFLALGAAPLLAFFWWGYLQRWELSEDMSAVHAHVLSASCEERIDMLPKGGIRKFFSPVVSYRYRANGIEYVSNRFSQYENYGFADEKKCQEAINELRKSPDDLYVFYRASNPAYSVITKEKPKPFFEALFSFIFAIFAIAGIYHQSKLLQERNRNE